MTIATNYVEADTEKALEDAQDRLDAFEKEVFSKNLMARFRRESPRHPILMGLAFTAVTSFLLGLTGILMAFAPLISGDLTRTFVKTPGLAMVPPGLLGLAFCGLLGWIALRVLASARAAKSPLLPKDLMEHNRLRSEVQRIKAAQNVNRRLSATPPPTRTRANY